MIQPLSPGELEKGRKNFMLFILVNNYAYFALSGNIITLLALRIQAGNLIVGLLSSFIFISYLFLIPGRELIKTAGTVRLLYRYYLARNLLMIPVVLVPFLSGRTALFIPVLVLTVFTFAFNTARGIHLTSDNPLMAELGGQNEQGSFLSRTLVGAYIISMASGVVVYFLLGGAAPLYMYAVIIGSGAAAGIIASRFLLRIPEPRSSTPQESGRLMASFLTAVKKRNLRNYFIILFLCFFSVSMIAPFIVVYFKQVFHALDSQIMLFTIAGNIGSLLMALLAGFSIDKLGAKPLYFAFAVITLATLVPPIAGFGVSGSAGLVITGCVLFFFQMMGTAGTYNAGRTYLLSALQHKEQLNFGVIYFFVIGVAGALGSFLGGLLLEVFLYSGLSLVNSFRLFFAIIALLYVVILVFLARLDATKPYSIRSALMFILSPRDLRALSLLKRLDVTKSIKEEKEVIQALKDSPSSLSTENIIQKLKSPSFEIRVKALDAFHSLPVDENVKEALISEVKNHPFTTAYIAADILGERGITEAVKPLRQVIRSSDYFLAGKSMVALAKLKDEESVPEIASIVRETQNPRLIIHGAKALEYFRSAESIPDLLLKLKQKSFPFIRDEIILAIAGINGMASWFYLFYAAFLEKGSTGILMLKDEVTDEKKALPSQYRERCVQMLDFLLNHDSAFCEQVFLLLADLRQAEFAMTEGIRSVFHGLTFPKIIKLERYRFLAAGTMIFALKNPD